MSSTVLVSGFAGLFAAMLALELLARFGPSRRATLGDVVNRAVARPAGRVVVLLSWLWLGWHLFVR